MSLFARFVSSALVCAAVFAPGNASAAFHSVFSQDGVDVWAVGDNSLIYRSLDGGVNWASTTPFSWRLNDVAAVGFHVLIVGESGIVARSYDSGGSWALASVAGSVDLLAIAMPSETIAYAVGAGGTIAKSSDGGTTWIPQSSGTSEILRALCMVDTLSGWVVGDGGTALETSDGGATWTPVAITTNDLRDVAVLDDHVWVVGARGTAFRSDNGGMSFTQLDLQLDAHADVDAVELVSADSVVLGGGGGFIRISADGGFNWEFARHKLHGRISGLRAKGGRMWAVTDRSNAIVLSLDGGATWQMPSGMSVQYSWPLKLEFFGGVRGHAIDFSRQNPDVIYAGLGADVYRSDDAGEHWVHHADFPATFNRSNALIVSPYDENIMVAAVSGNFDRVIRTDNGGATWLSTLAVDFGEYGIPLEMHPDKPDTLYFGGDSVPLYRSTDFGLTWALWGADTLRSPCDIVVVPGHTDTILVGDGVTGSGQGQYLRSTNGGASFSVQQTQPIGASEIPGMASSRLRPSVIFGTNWGSGGVQRSSNFGATWPTIITTGSAWGVDVSRDDPNCMMFGTYAGLQTHISVNGGDSFTQVGISGANYSFLARDREHILAVQSNGIYKLSTAYSYAPNSNQMLSLVSPTGGATLTPGSVVNIQWTQTNVPLVRVQFRAATTDTFTTVALVAGPLGHYDWSVPYVATNQAQVRVVDGWDVSPVSTTSPGLTIALPLIAADPADLDFGTQPAAGSRVLPVTIENTGTAVLQVTSISTATVDFAVGRTSFSIGAGSSDTVGVLFEPTIEGLFADTLVIASDGYNAPTWKVPLAGASTYSPIVLLDEPNGGEVWQYDTQHDIRWQALNVDEVAIEYQFDPLGGWATIIPSTSATAGTYPWTIPNTRSDAARVRVRDLASSAEAVSAANFTIAVPGFTPGWSLFQVPQTMVGTTTTDSLQLNNPGNGALVISSIVSDNPNFWPGRSSFAIPAGTVDTIGVSFHAMSEGPDSAIFVFTANDPFTPHQVKVYGYGVTTIAVAEAQVTSFALQQNQPNPFGSVTTIHYALPIETDVSLEVFNLQGQRVTTLVRGLQQPGRHTALFAPGRGVQGRALGDLAAGVYFYRLKAGGFTSTRKMLLVR